MFPKIVIEVVQPGLTDKYLWGAFLNGLQRQPSFASNFPGTGKIIQYRSTSKKDDEGEIFF